MARLDPFNDRKRSVMRKAAKRWQERSRGQQVIDQLASLGGDASGMDTPLREKKFAERQSVLQREPVTQKTITEIIEQIMIPLVSVG